MSAELCWNSACATLLTELGIDIKELLQKKYLKEYFVSAVRSEKLSQAAANSLLYRLYYLGLLLDVDLLVHEGSVKIVPDLGDEHSAISAAVRWQELAVDGPKLDSIVLPYINAARSTVQRIFETLNK